MSSSGSVRLRYEKCLLIWGNANGDLEWVRKLPQPKVKGLHRHNVYCVENLLLCQNAIASLVAQDVVLSEEDAIKAVKFSDWVNRIDQPLTNLFAAYATAQELHPQLKTVSTGVGVMCTKPKKGIASALDNAKVEGHRITTLTEVEKVVGKAKAHASFVATKKRIRSLPFPLDAVSGKDFLLPLLGFHLQSLGAHSRRKSLRVRLASMCDESKLLDLKASVNMAARNWA